MMKSIWWNIISFCYNVIIMIIIIIIIMPACDLASSSYIILLQMHICMALYKIII